MWFKSFGKGNTAEWSGQKTQKKVGYILEHFTSMISKWIIGVILKS
jgi:hypothetical protein